MGLGAYLAAVTDADHYASEEKRECDEVLTRPEDEKEEIFQIMDGYGISREATSPLVAELACNPQEWIRVCILFLLLRSFYCKWSSNTDSCSS
jgi:hypothetical protein